MQCLHRDAFGPGGVGRTAAQLRRPRRPSRRMRWPPATMTAPLRSRPSTPAGVRAGRSPPRRARASPDQDRQPRRARARARRRPRRHPPPRAAGQPSGEHVLRAHHRRALERARAPMTWPRRCCRARDVSAVDVRSPGRAAPRATGRSLDQRVFGDAYATELHKLSAQLATRLLPCSWCVGAVRVRGAAEGAERHAVRRPVRRLRAHLRVCHLARDPRLRRRVGLPDHRRRCWPGTCSPPRTATAPGRRSSPARAPARTCSRASCWPPAPSPSPSACSWRWRRAWWPARRSSAPTRSSTSAAVLTSPGRSLALTIVSWLYCVLPLLAYTSLAILFSVATPQRDPRGARPAAWSPWSRQLLDLIGKGVCRAPAADRLGLRRLARPVHHAIPFLGPLLVSSLVALAWIAGLPRRQPGGSCAGATSWPARPTRAPELATRRCASSPRPR